MITYSKLGHAHHGRLGNQLFQIASTIGLAARHGHEYTFPAWQYSQYLAEPLPTGGRFEAWSVPEKSFTYQEEAFISTENYDLDGWRQSEKYWSENAWLVRHRFTFKQEFEAGIRVAFKLALSRPAIAISVRRGDFVDNPNYDQIPVKYYILALLEAIPSWRDYNIIFFSDDAEYCRVQFEGVPNSFFSSGTDIEQLCLMTICKHFIIGNSTFSWWGAWLGEKEGTIVVRPPLNFAGPLARQNNERDYWPERWKIVDYRNRRIDLKDVTFTIPVFIDHVHRWQNLELSVAMLTDNFDTNIIVGEQGSSKAQAIRRQARYVGFTEMKNFHRTKMLNDMAKLATTPIVVNWDADVFIPPFQIWEAADKIRTGDDMVYPFDGRFARVPRVWYERLKVARDVGIFGGTEFKGKHGHPLPTTSVGGAIMFNREAFLNGGGENEYMISFGPEDWERNFRFNQLGYTVTRVNGALYHLDHWCGPNSSTRNPYFRQNHKELDEMRELSTEELENYVSSWPWRP